MTGTDELIRALAADGRPVRRLWPVAPRLALWCAGVAGVVGLAALWHGARPDILDLLAAPSFLLHVLYPAATGIAAAIAGLMLCRPERSTAWLLLPLPTLVLWVSDLGYGCLAHWSPITPGSIPWHEASRCLTLVLVLSLPLSALTIAMLRSAAVVRPRAVLVAGFLAVSATASSAMTMLHELDATALVLFWDVGLIAVVALIGLRSSLARVGRRRAAAFASLAEQ